jgi:hypothetical protein
MSEGARDDARHLRPRSEAVPKFTIQMLQKQWSLKLSLFPLIESQQKLIDLMLAAAAKVLCN